MPNVARESEMLKCIVAETKPTTAINVKEFDLYNMSESAIKTVRQSISSEMLSAVTVHA